MTADQFRRWALAGAGATEGAHMGHPDFRAGGRIFASLGVPTADSAMVRLSPERQAELIRAHPEIFRPASGAWGQQGCTWVSLSAATEETLKPVLAEACAARLAANSRRAKKATKSR